MRTIIFLWVCCFGALANAQVWCPTGASWNYNLLSFGIEGCQTRTYVGDTMIDGLSAQHIIVNTGVMNYFTNTWETNVSDFYTAQDGGIIYAWNVSGNSLSWDTLYWLSALPGDRWYPPDADDLCAGQGLLGMLEVSDTGNVLVSGQSLRYVDVTFLDGFGQPEGGVFHIIERLGSPLMTIYPGGCLVAEAGGELRTYVDDDFPMYDSGVPSLCDQITSLSEAALEKTVHVYPNPGEDMISISGYALAAVGHLLLRDTSGREVLHERMDTGKNTVSVAVLSSGVYAVELTTNAGVRSLGKWVKR
jgi:hypothetical protein